MTLNQYEAMRIRFYEPESFVLDIKRCQIAIRTKFHIYTMLSDMYISSVGYQLGYSLAVGIVNSLHHFDLLGHLSSPSLGGHCPTLFNHNLLRYLLAFGQKFIRKSQHFNHNIILIPPFPKTRRAEPPRSQWPPTNPVRTAETGR